MAVDDLENRFKFHPADIPERQEAHHQVRSACLALAQIMNYQLKDGREKSLAITKLEEVMFWANASIARGSEM
jgi:hypothetical protein